MVATATKSVPPPFESDDFESWLTFEQAQIITGISRPTLKKWATEGRIRSGRAQRYGTHHIRVVLHPGDVAKCQRSSMRAERLISDADEFAARVFEYFDAGRTIREIVVLARAQPDRIENLREKWLDGGGADMIISATARAELERYIGPFQTIAELVERMRSLHGATIEATVPDALGDAEIEARVIEALDQATAP